MALVSRLMGRHHSGASRHATRCLLGVKLGDALAKRNVPPHGHESAAKAQAFLREAKRGA